LSRIPPPRHRKEFVIGAIAFGLALSGAAGLAVQRHFFPKDNRMTAPNLPDMSALKPDMAFTCAYEKDLTPPYVPEAEQLYQYARWLRQANMLDDKPAAYPPIERLVRIASAYGHNKANLALRGMLKNGQAQSANPIKESVDLVEDLIARGMPGGFYDMGNYLMQGYGVVGNTDLAIRYFRKAADLGSPDAQFMIADKLTDARTHAPDIVEIGLQMYRCAAEQGHAEAALNLGVYIYEKAPLEAMKIYQLGVKAGSAQSASRMELGFQLTDPTEVGYLGLTKPDPERARRYEAVWQLLSKYDYRAPKVPEIDEIVPLPPAKLPPWDGKFQWLEAHKANVPPPLPTEARIAEMARAKGLDPKTGRPVTTGK
jgi:TPR repeat protein